MILNKKKRGPKPKPIKQNPHVSKRKEKEDALSAVQKEQIREYNLKTYGVADLTDGKVEIYTRKVRKPGELNWDTYYIKLHLLKHGPQKPNREFKWGEPTFRVPE